MNNVPEPPTDHLAVLNTYRMDSGPIFVVGSFDSGITVFSQQVRALNLVWAIIESGVLNRGHTGAPPKVAVVGAGFAGMTIAAGLVRKGVDAEVTLFERRDTVLPLQQGSDSRWLHPHIYDWPRPGSESNSAALPVLNWTASRASDVVVQTLEAWNQLITQPPSRAATRTAGALKVYCNTQHLQVGINGLGPEIEWVGDLREASNPSIPSMQSPQGQGRSEKFDLVILAVGFGLERDTSTSYWRNETFAQPYLGQARSTYIVSGAGDGAMIDLFRLRISQYRQDRILGDLFRGASSLLEHLRTLCMEDPGDLFQSLDMLWNRQDLVNETQRVQKALQDRLRHDTHVILHLLGDASFARRLNSPRRISFQNRVLAFLLFKAGGFFPSANSLASLAHEHSVPDDRVINRHGTATGDGLKAVLAKPLHAEIERALSPGAEILRQTDSVLWPAAFFDMTDDTGEATKGHWRKEYLPSPTQSIAATFCAAVAGQLRRHHSGNRLRVTLHRTLVTGHETVLQQCCEYQGTSIGSRKAAGRTFPIANATIGAAYSSGRIVRSKATVTNAELDQDMRRLKLNEASRAMAEEVVSVAAIPLLHDHHASDGQGRLQTVVAVLYLDSDEEGFFADDQRMGDLIEMTNAFLETISDQQPTVAGRIANTAFWTGKNVSTPSGSPPAPPTSQWEALEPLDGIEPPSTTRLGYLNYDFSDFAPIEEALP